MKKFLPWFTIALCIITLSTVYLFVLQQEKLETQTTQLKTTQAKLDDYQNRYSDIYYTLDSILPEHFSQKVANNDTFYVYIGRPSCSDCQFFEPILIEAIKQYNLQHKLVYVNVAPLKSSPKTWQDFKQTYGIQGTPVLAKVENGKLVNILDFEAMGGINASQLAEWLKTNQLAN